MNVLALHIPDGFLSLPVACVGWAVSLPFVIWALRKTHEVEDKTIPLAGLLSAFVFAAQTLQFPIPGGTTGHLVGATLVTILLGPTLGVVVLTAVLILQALIFGEGGLLALGWNVTNMAVVMGLMGAGFFHTLRRRGAGLGLSAFVAAWFATQAGSLVTCLELAAAKTSPLLVSLPAMFATQALVGLGEGLVTVFTIGFLNKARPDFLIEDSLVTRRLGLALTVAVGALTLSPPRFYGLEAQTLFSFRYPGLLLYLGLLVGAVALWGLVGLVSRKSRE